jgi:aldose 1-epimerase
MKAAGPPGAGAPIGYDENWIVNGDPNALRPVAKVKDPKSGRVLTVESNQPGVQFYSGIFMDGSTKGKGRVHAQYTGMCLEAQKFPNSINVPAWKKDVVLRPGETYKHVITHKFSAE